MTTVSESAPVPMSDGSTRLFLVTFAAWNSISESGELDWRCGESATRKKFLADRKQLAKSLAVARLESYRAKLAAFYTEAGVKLTPQHHAWHGEGLQEPRKDGEAHPQRFVRAQELAPCAVKKRKLAVVKSGAGGSGVASAASAGHRAS